MPQCETKQITVKIVMGSAAFRVGVETARRGEPFPPSYDRMSKPDQAHFERGRMFACLVPKDMPFKSGNVVSRNAANIFVAAYNRGEII